MRAACQDCAAAELRPHYGFRKGCPDCEIRQLAGAPRHVREAAYKTIAHQAGMPAALALKAAVAAEYKRMQAIKEATRT